MSGNACLHRRMAEGVSQEGFKAPGIYRGLNGLYCSSPVRNKRRMQEMNPGVDPLVAYFDSGTKPGWPIPYNECENCPHYVAS